MQKRILIFLIIIIFCLGFLVAKEAKAGETHNVWGWAWSENLGWISFNNISGLGPVNYGVHIDSDGNFSGYAWSRGTSNNLGGIGWIKFDPAGPYPSTPSYSACLDLPASISTSEACNGVGDYTVSGWARAYRAIAPLGQTLGGWGGWIKLGGGGSTYGVTLDATGESPYEFHSWAWGGDDTDEKAVTGWVSFNDEDFDGSPGPVDYQVVTDLVITPANNPPTAAISCNPSCSEYVGTSLLLMNNSTDPDPGDQITISDWYQKGQTQDDSAYVLKLHCTISGNPLCNYLAPLSVGAYTAKLYVEDEPGASNEATKDFEIKRDIIAGFMCSLDDITWQVCESLTPTPEMGNTIYFKDDPSTLGEYSVASEGATITTWAWTKNESSFGSNSFHVSTEVTAASMTIELTVTDTASRTDPVSHIIGAGTMLPLPEWREIPPAF